MKKLLILSGKGGTGKTTTAAAFIKFSGAKATADCDVDAPNLHLVNHQTVEPVISDFIGGDKAFVDTKRCTACGECIDKCRFNAVDKSEDGFIRIRDISCEGCGVCEYICPEKAIVLKKDTAGRKVLYIDCEHNSVFSTAELKMGRGNSGKLVTAVKMAMLNNAPDTELAIIDGSPGIGCPVIASINGMNLVLIVAEPSRSGFSDLVRLVKTAEKLNTRLAVCVNKWDVNPKETELIIKFCIEKNIPYVGSIPFDKKAVWSINNGKSLIDTDCKAAEALRDVYNKTISLLISD